MKERPILFSGPMVRALPAKRMKVYARPGETFNEYIARRLLNRCKPNAVTGCWDWVGSAKASGHAVLTLGGRTELAYRVAYGRWVAPIPPGKFVLHKCDNPRCIRPDHLEVGDQTKNMGDCALRGRSAKGARNGKAKLSEQAAKDIRRLIAEGWSYAKAGAAFGVSASTAGRIHRGEAWR